MSDSFVLRIRMAHEINAVGVLLRWTNPQHLNALAELEANLRRIVAEEVAAALALRQAAREEEARDE